MGIARESSVQSGRKLGYQGLINGMLAMAADSASGIYPMLTAQTPFVTGRVPNAPGGRNGTWAGCGAYIIPFNAPDKVLSGEILRFMSETETQLARWVAPSSPNAPIGNLPANLEALLRVSRTLAPQYQNILNQVTELNAIPALWSVMYTATTAADRAVVAGTKTPTQAVSDIQKEMGTRFKEVFGE